jgi:multidrug efflux pump subunit AcrA (membrane-fusion protein)
VLDVEQMEIQAKVTETDRGNLESGQQIEARVDALPLQRFAGKIKSLAGMAASGAFFSDTSAVRSFDASFEFKSNGVELNPGCTAQVTIQGGTVKDALSLPRQALFRKEGKPCVYVKEAQGWKPTDVQIKHLTESRIVVEGISQGTEVALVNPEVDKGLAAGKAGRISSMLGGMFQ